MSGVLRSPLADYHVSQGATLGEYHGVVVPARFSDPRAEHAAVRAASGLFDFSFRAKIAVKGEDRARFLQGMVSNDVLELPPGRGRRALLLNSHGQILADLCVYAEAERFLLDTDADLRGKVIETLERYIIMDDVRLEPLELYALAFQGPRARPLLEKSLHVDLPEMSEYDHLRTNYAGHPVRVVRRTSTGEEGYEVWIGPKALSPLWGAACGQAPTYDTLPCGAEALETLRIEAGISAYGAELAEDTLPLEAGALDAVSFTKGCYLGQEIVERARSRGHVNWKLVGVFIASERAPEPGTKLLADSKEVGEITSACASPTLGRVIALAYVRREAAEPGTNCKLAP
jgi:glycine cleavage system T protein